MSKILITSIRVGVSKAGKEYAHISAVNLADGSVFEGFLDPKVAQGVEATDLKDLEALADNAEFDQKGRVVHIGK